MEKYLPQKGKVHENNTCLTALVIFAKLFLYRQNLPHIDDKLTKYTLFNTAAKSIYPDQPAQSAQADLGRNYLLLTKFLYVQGPVNLII